MRTPKLPTVGDGAPAAGQDSNYVEQRGDVYGGERRRQETRPRSPALRGCAGGPSPEPGERGGAGAPAAPGTRREARAGSSSGPRGHVRLRSRGASAPGGPGAGAAGAGFGGPGRGRAPTHLPAGAAARAGGQRGAAAGVHVVGDAQHPQEGETQQHPRAPPHPPHSAAGRGAAARECCLGRRGAEEGEGRARLRLLLPRGLPIARRGRRALGAELRPRPGAPRGARAGSGGQGVREQRATNRRAAGRGRGRRRGITASPGRQQPAAPPPRVLAPRPAAPVSDRWLPGPERSAHARAHAGGTLGPCCLALPCGHALVNPRSS